MFRNQLTSWPRSGNRLKNNQLYRSARLAEVDRGWPIDSQSQPALVSWVDQHKHLGNNILPTYGQLVSWFDELAFIVQNRALQQKNQTKRFSGTDKGNFCIGSVWFSSRVSPFAVMGSPIFLRGLAHFSSRASPISIRAWFATENSPQDLRMCGIFAYFAVSKKT